MGNILNTGSFALEQKSMDALWLKMRVISNNIANIDTPGYKSKTVEFEELLKAAVGGSADRTSLEEKIGSVEPEIRENVGTQAREDGNNVDADSEYIELTRAQLQYEAMALLSASQISRLKYVISGGSF